MTIVGTPIWCSVAFDRKVSASAFSPGSPGCNWFTWLHQLAFQNSKPVCTHVLYKPKIGADVTTCSVPKHRLKDFAMRCRTGLSSIAWCHDGSYWNLGSMNHHVGSFRPQSDTHRAYVLSHCLCPAKAAAASPRTPRIASLYNQRRHCATSSAIYGDRTPDCLCKQPKGPFRRPELTRY